MQIQDIFADWSYVFLLLINLAVVAYFLFLWCLICLGISLSYFIPCL